MAEEIFRTERTQGEEGAKDRVSARAIPCLSVAAIADDLLANRARLVPLSAGGLLIGRGEPDSFLQQSSPNELRIKDNRMSGRHAALLPTEGGILVEDLGSTNGTRINDERIRTGLLSPGSYLEVRHSLLACGVLDEAELLPLAETTMLGPTRSVDPSLLGILQRARQIAPSTVSALLLGESGTGKEVLARSIHEQSGRRGRWVAVHCGAIPENLIESELFGYKKGAFTGALSSQEGLVAAADGGTLFLGEIGEMPAAAQVRLLRVLQEHEVLPVGETRPRKVDNRVIAATNKDLRSLALGDSFAAISTRAWMASRFACLAWPSDGGISAC